LVKAVAPFAWQRLPRLRRADVALMRALDRHLQGPRAATAWPTLAKVLGAPPVVTPLLARAVEGPEVRGELGGDALVVLSSADQAFAVAVPSELAVRLCLKALGAAEEEAVAPRPLSPAERGVLTYLVLAALARVGGQARVEGMADADAVAARLGPGPVAVLPLVLRVGELCGEVRILLPQALLLRPPPGLLAAELLERAGPLLARLPAELPVELARTVFGSAELGALGRGDVVVFAGGRRPWLRVGRGGFRLGEPGWRILSDFEPGEEGDMSHSLSIEGLPVELVVELGRVRTNARQVLELRPGSIVELARPAGAPVDLVAAGRVLARGELVDVEGELGVRVTEILATS
jgi:flagellar motor switch protein FliN